MSNTNTKIENLFDQVAEKIFKEVFFRRTDGHDNEICRNIQLNNELDNLVIDILTVLSLEDPDHPHLFDNKETFHNGTPINWDSVIEQFCFFTFDSEIDSWEIVIKRRFPEIINNEFTFMYFYSYFHKNYHKKVYESFKEALESSVTKKTGTILNNSQFIRQSNECMFQFLTRRMRREKKYEEIELEIDKEWADETYELHKIVDKNIETIFDQLKKKKKYTYSANELYGKYYNDEKNLKAEYTKEIVVDYTPDSIVLNEIVDKYKKLYYFPSSPDAYIDNSDNEFSKVRKEFDDKKICNDNYYIVYASSIILRGLCNDLIDSWKKSANRFFIEKDIKMPDYYIANSIFYPYLDSYINKATLLNEFLCNTSSRKNEVWQSIFQNFYKHNDLSDSKYILGIKMPSELFRGIALPHFAADHLSDLLFAYYINYLLPEKKEDKKGDNIRNTVYEIKLFEKISESPQYHFNYLEESEKYICFKDNFFTKLFKYRYKLDEKRKCRVLLTYMRNKKKIFNQIEEYDGNDINFIKRYDKKNLENVKRSRNTYLFWGDLISTIIEYILIMCPIDNQYDTIKSILSVFETDYVIDYYNRYKKNQNQNFKNHIQIIKE